MMFTLMIKILAIKKTGIKRYKYEKKGSYGSNSMWRQRH